MLLINKYWCTPGMHGTRHMVYLIRNCFAKDVSVLIVDEFIVDAARTSVTLMFVEVFANFGRKCCCSRKWSNIQLSPFSFIKVLIKLIFPKLRLKVMGEKN